MPQPEKPYRSVEWQRFRSDWRDRFASVRSGFLFCVVLAMAAQFAGDEVGIPVILAALLLGMAFPHIADDHRYAAGIEWCARGILRLGVALLGVRLSWQAVAEDGVIALGVILIAVPATIAFSLVLGRWLKLPRTVSLLAGAAVAICGVAAALAVAAALSQRFKDERHLLCVAVGVTGLSTMAMITYPLLVTWLALPAHAAGLFLGGTIHDVAQVAGAGYMISNDVGDFATFSKMLRVMLLVPLVVLIAWIVRENGARRTKVPAFLVGFVMLAVAANVQVLPFELVGMLTALSKFCLMLTMVALGTRIRLGSMLQVGWRPMALLGANTVFLAAIVLGMIGAGF